MTVSTQNVAFRTPIVHKFLNDLFGSAWPGVWVAGIPGDPNDRANVSCWRGGPADKDAPHLDTADNLYYSVSVVKAGRRVAPDFVEAPIIVLDDVGSKISPIDVISLSVFGSPRWIVHTSQKSEQWVFRLEKPITDPRIFERIMRAIAAKGLTDPGTIDVVRAMRLPAGINGKPKYGSPSPVVSYSFDGSAPDIDFYDLCLALGLDPIEMLDPDSWAAPVSSSLKVGGSADLAKPDLMLSALQDLGRVIGPGREQGVVDIECPFSDEHTAREDSGTSYFGRGAFKCHHGHCQGKTNWDFKAKVRSLYDEKHGPAALSGLAFACEPIDDGTVHALEASFRQATGTDSFTSWAEAFGRFIYLERSGNFFDTATSSFLDNAGFNAKMSRLVPFGSTGLKSATAMFVNSRDGVGGRGVPQFADGVTYVPGGPNATRHHRLGRVVNRWTPPALLLPPAGSVSDADVKPWLDHIDLIFPDAAAREVVLDWMRWVVQKPGRKINWAPLILGGQGIGKDTAFLPVFAAAGSDNTSFVTPQALQGSFNDWVVAQIVVVEEVAAFGKADFYNELKPLIAAPPAEVRVNEKFTKPYTIPNQQVWVFFTNKDDAIQVENDDRRLWVYASPASKQDAVYYDMLHDWLKADGVERVIRWLMDGKIGSNWSETTCPADVLGHKAAMAVAAAPACEQWVVHQTEAAGAFAGRSLLTVREVTSLARVQLRGQGHVNDQLVASGLKAAGWVSSPRIRAGGGRHRFWFRDAATAAQWVNGGAAARDAIVAAWEKEAGATGFPDDL